MKKHLLLILAIMFIVSIYSFASAQEATDTATTVDQQAIQTTAEETITAQDLGVSDPTLLPDSKWYFLKNWKNAVQSVFTFGQVAKAELNLKIASEKLLEAQKLAEKTENPQILEKATDLYNQRVEKIQANIAKFKGTATSSEKVSKFLDKYTKQQILQNQILEKLETKVPTSTMEKIQEAREKHLEQFGQVMQKLEDKDKIQERLEKGLENLKESAVKPIVKLEILKKLEDKFPTSTIQQLQQAKVGVLQKLNEKLQTMPAEAQQKVENYLEKVKGAVEKKRELINEIKESLPATSTLRQKVEIIKEKLESTTTTIRRYGQDCVCTMEYNPVCGADGKTYGNPCKAKCLNVAIVSQGPCKRTAVTTSTDASVKPKVIGGQKDEHGCLTAAGYSWCEAKQKCLRTWEEKCPILTTETTQWYPISDDQDNYAPGCDIGDNTGPVNIVPGPGSYTGPGGCAGTHIIKDVRVSKEISCLRIEVNNCNGGIIDITNNCKTDIIINDKTMSGGYIGIDPIRETSGVLSVNHSDGNFSAYKPAKDDIIELTIKAGNEQAILKYTKTGPLCSENQ